MERLVSRLSLLGLALAALSIGSATAQTSPVRQDTISYAEGTPFEPANPANAALVGPRRCWTIPLHYITPDIFLSELDQAMVPHDGPVILKPGQTMRSAFRIQGVDAMIVSRRNNTLVVICTVYGFDVMHQIVRCLDVSPALTGKSRPTGYAPGEEKYEANTHSHYHFFELPLLHTHPNYILTQLNQAYLPNNGEIILEPGEVIRNGFKVDDYGFEGLRLLIPNRRNDSFLIYSSSDSFAGIKAIIQQLDQPASLRTEK